MTIIFDISANQKLQWFYFMHFNPRRNTSNKTKCKFIFIFTTTTTKNQLFQIFLFNLLHFSIRSIFHPLKMYFLQFRFVFLNICHLFIFIPLQFDEFLSDFWIFLWYPLNKCNFLDRKTKKKKKNTSWKYKNCCKSVLWIVKSL